MDQGIGLTSMPRSALLGRMGHAVLVGAVEPESATHSEVVITMSMTMVTMMGRPRAAPAGPPATARP
jgi:hypothetical protein